MYNFDARNRILEFPEKSAAIPNAKKYNALGEGRVTQE
jgi:hypothetical protein